MRRPEIPSPETAAAAGYRLRRMVAADLDELMVIERQAFKHPWSAELFRRELTHEWSTILVAEEAMPGAPSFGSAGSPSSSSARSPLAGFVIYWLVHDEIHILNIATDPKRRRQGIARLLLAECVCRGKSAGARLATLEVRRSNIAAIRLYESFGFHSVGVRPNYYADEGEDAIVMDLSFGD